jgi:hypothetical protein
MKLKNLVAMADVYNELVKVNSKLVSIGDDIHILNTKFDTFNSNFGYHNQNLIKILEKLSGK